MLCDRVAIMDHGKVIALGTPNELMASVPMPPKEPRAARGDARGRVRRADRKAPAR